ncbi:MAG: Hsp20 family protein [Candidatus Polarisedimenticolaceae bacterium]|nr:Hsp20 family protein [Candidatus Polarisedimenticolaceae bacterium]
MSITEEPDAVIPHVRICMGAAWATGCPTITVSEGGSYYRKERFDGTFRRTLTLPEDVDPDKVDASYKDGVLHITVQRREVVKPRQIKIK